MLKINDVIELEIEKLTYGSTALARYGKEKYVIFVPNAVPKDIVKVKIIKLNKKFAQGEIVEIIKESEFRTKPFCALYKPCGSCSFQNINYESLIKEKQIVLEDIYKNVIDKDKILPIIKSPQTKEYRHKIQYPTRQTKNSKRILMGYYKQNSHEIINIKHCPIQPKIIDDIAMYIRENFKLDCYNEAKNTGILRNFVARVANENQDILVVFVINTKEKVYDKKYRSYFEKFSKKLMQEFMNIKGCFVNFNALKTNLILTLDTKLILGRDSVIEELGDKKYKIGPNSFFQVNPSCAEKMFDFIKENINENSTILDAYGGVGAIGIYLSDKAKKITLVEENLNAIENARENFKMNNILNFEIFEGDAMKNILNFQKENKKFDYVILDPPRSGCGAEGLKAISKIANKIIYVSCNPQTQKRDIAVLNKDGFKLKLIQGVDLFPFTYHIESVAILEK